MSSPRTHVTHNVPNLRISSGGRESSILASAFVARADRTQSSDRPSTERGGARREVGSDRGKREPRRRRPRDLITLPHGRARPMPQLVHRRADHDVRRRPIGVPERERPCDDHAALGLGGGRRGRVCARHRADRRQDALNVSSQHHVCHSACLVRRRVD